MEGIKSKALAKRYISITLILYVYIDNILEKEEMKRLTPLKAIRVKCLDCSGFQPSEIRNCGITDCPLYPYRFGKNPNRAGIGGQISIPTQKGNS